MKPDYKTVDEYRHTATSLLERVSRKARGLINTDKFDILVLSIYFYKAICEKRRLEIEAALSADESSSDFIDNMESSYFDEITTFSIPARSDFFSLAESLDRKDLLHRLISALQAIEKANESLKGIFDEAISILSNADTKGGLENFCKNTFEALSYSSSYKSYNDDHSIIFRILTDEIYKNSFYKHGMTKTPQEIADLLIRLVKPKAEETIYDPTCGTGTLLASCLAQDKQLRNEKNRSHLYGQEVNHSDFNLARMNLIISGGEKSNIRLGDSIKNPQFLDEKSQSLSKFDVVISTPPFSMKLMDREGIENDPYGRFKWGMPSKNNADYVFISHMLSSMNTETGRMAVVVPHGVLFRGSSEREIRKNIINDNLLDCVIGLPQNLFLGTSIPTVILVFKANKVDQKVYYIDASKEFKHEKRQNKLTEQSIKKAIDCYEKRPDIPGYSRIVSVSEIVHNDYNLNIPRYIEEKIENQKIDVKFEIGRIQELESDLFYLTKEMNNLLSKL